MKAQEARKITESYSIDAPLQRIYKLIEVAAKDGVNIARATVDSSWARDVDKIITQLKSDGYKVERESYSDFRESWNYLQISW